MKQIVPVLACLGFACGSPECIYCTDIEGYPNGVICSDSFEAIPEDPKFSWAEFSDEALQDGCTEAEGD